MGRATPETRAEAVRRVLDGAGYAQTAEVFKVKVGTLRQWVKRHRDAATDGSVIELAPAIDLATLDPVALLEHDIAVTRRRCQLAEDRGVLTAIAPLTKQTREMQRELEALRANQPVDREDTDAERVEILTAHMRVLRWCREVAADRQARTMLARALAEVEAGGR